MLHFVVPMCQCGTRRARGLVRPGDFLLLRRSVRDEKIFPTRRGCDWCQTLKRYLINHLISMMLSGQCFVFLFCQGTERPHQGDVKNGVAIPNTTEEVHNRIMLDPEMIEQPSFVYGDSGGVWISYRPVVKHLLGKISNRDLEFCVVGSSCDEKRLGIRSGVVMGLMTGGRGHGVNMAIG